MVIIIQKHLEVYGNITKMSQDEPDDKLTDSESFTSKIKISGKTPADGSTKVLK